METTHRPLATVERAIGVLDTLAESTTDLGNNEIALRTGLNVSTTSRLLATLVQAELVSRVRDTGRYRLGPRLIELCHAALAKVDLRGAARGHLIALTEVTGETATLSVPGENHVLTVDFVQSPSSVRSVAQLGRPAIAHATATGKVFLAYAEGLEAEPLPANELVPYTSRTIVDRADLAEEIALVRRRGWAEAVGEREDDLNAVAAPVLDLRGSLIGVLGLQGPSTRFDAQARSTAANALVEHAARLATGQ
jgi:DNA-binding IclR family transcriptional regulator